MPRTPKPFTEAARLTLADGAPVSSASIESLIHRQEKLAAPRLANLWAYYRNQMEPCSSPQSGRAYRLAQERGLPPRILGAWDRRTPAARFTGDDRAWQRKEVVVENDIAWRVQTMVDFMFGRPLKIASTAADPALRNTIEQALAAVWDASGGIALMQDLGLLGHVYGHVDLLIRTQESPSRERGQTTPTHPTLNDIPSLGEAETGGSIPERAAASVRVEVIEPPRGVALPSERDYREIDAYIIRTQREPRADEPAFQSPALAGTLMRWWRSGLEGQRPNDPATARDLITTTEIFAGASRQLYETTPAGQTTLIDEGPALVHLASNDRPPIVHIQNISQPFEYAGIGEVEPLIPLQDELNTRLSDRANRVTLQSFKMYLAKGLDGAASMPIAPGIIWSTDNPDAQVTAFGGDGASPSEDRHIDEVREALDKASAVPPLASGVVRAKIGNLSSENALRITLLGLISKTNRKRITYGRGITRASQLILEALHRLNILETAPRDRGLRLDWTDPIPRDEQLALLAAQKKVDLGVPREQVLAELGY